MIKIRIWTGKGSKRSFRLPLKKRVSRERYFTALLLYEIVPVMSTFQATRSLRAERRSYMLTLQELKQVVDVPGFGVKIPTAKCLRTSRLAIVQERSGLDSKISVYQSGYVLYHAGKHSTVFLLHLCRDYLYLADGKTVILPEQFFENKEWYLRLVLEGEDWLSRNHEEKERNWNIPYSAISEDWAAMEDQTESVMEQLVRRETVAEILESLPARQKYIIQKYYLQEETQEQISNELGISQQAVSFMLSQAIRSIRKNDPVFQNPPARRICYEGGRV